LLISHDRELLDTLIDQCLFFENDEVVMRPGSYTSGMEQYRLERKTAVRERKVAKGELMRLESEAKRRARIAPQGVAVGGSIDTTATAGNGCVWRLSPDRTERRGDLLGRWMFR
jgi:hypothetical protein